MHPNKLVICKVSHNFRIFENINEIDCTQLFRFKCKISKTAKIEGGVAKSVRYTRKV